MNESKKAIKATLVADGVFMALLSASFLIMPVANGISLNEGKNGLLYFSGGLFWASLVFEAITLIIASVMRRKAVKGTDSVTKKLPGAFRFFSNKAAKITDPLAAAVFIGFIICAFVTDKYITYVFLAAALFLIQLHCVVNGRSFEYINS